MKHHFLVTIEGDMTQKQAQKLLKDVGTQQGSLPPEERLTFRLSARPVTRKPTLITSRG
jgi:hypothetical protein